MSCTHINIQNTCRHVNLCIYCIIQVSTLQSQMQHTDNDRRMTCCIADGKILVLYAKMREYYACQGCLCHFHAVVNLPQPNTNHYQIINVCALCTDRYSVLGHAIIPIHRNRAYNAYTWLLSCTAVVIHGRSSTIIRSCLNASTLTTTTVATSLVCQLDPHRVH